MSHFLDWSNDELDRLAGQLDVVMGKIDMLAGFSQREAFELRVIERKCRSLADRLAVKAHELETQESADDRHHAA